MDTIYSVQSIKNIPSYYVVMEKLTIAPTTLTETEKTFILACAILLIKKYQEDKRCKSYIELAYYIILKYSLTYSDYEPLYDFSINFGFYPIAQAITKEQLIEFTNIPSSILHLQIDSNFKTNSIIETLAQKKARENILLSDSKEISFVAPTSFGKSSIIFEHIKNNMHLANRIGIIVPTKSLLTQTYRNIKKQNYNIKLLFHDEMFNGEEKFIAIFTQERALRLMEKHNMSFDILYIDEAHRLLERDSRSVLLSRLIKLNKLRNKNAQTLYLSPLLSNSDNLKIVDSQTIFEQRIDFNIKEPEIFEYRLDKSIQKYNRFIDTFFPISRSDDMFQYIQQYKTEKTFCYLYSPKKIEHFAFSLAQTSTDIELTKSIEEIIYNLQKYIHEDFFVIEYLKKGIIYLHGKMPDNIKDYLEYKFSTVPEIQFLIANKVILEGINLPIDSLFILNGTNLHEKDLINLIGRVNRLNFIFGTSNNLQKLLPHVHFINSTEYNRSNGRLENKVRLLKNMTYSDKIKNPLLVNYDPEKAEENTNIKEKCEKIISDENDFFSTISTPIQELKRKMIALGMNSIYSLSDALCTEIYKRINKMKDSAWLHKTNYIDRLRTIFVKKLETAIIDEEFKRLKYDETISYYKMFLENRKKSLKENITKEIKYYKQKIDENNSLLFIGESYGEVAYPTSSHYSRPVYIDLKDKSEKQMVNIAIVKFKLENDFINYKLNMFFQLMYDYELLNTEEYYNLVYGTTNNKKIQLIKIGLSLNLVNKLEDDMQLTNLAIDENNNIVTNKSFENYKQHSDDYYRFELSRFI